jgi:hypothetical protein
MIRHIPNKYSTLSLLDEINIQFRGKYDFFYLPMDFEVINTNFRINVTSAMHSSTLSIASTSSVFTTSLRQENGRNINRIKNAICPTQNSKENLN